MFGSSFKLANMVYSQTCAPVDDATFGAMLMLLTWMHYSVLFVQGFCGPCSFLQMLFCAFDNQLWVVAAGV